MIKLGTVKDMHRVSHLDTLLQDRIRACLATLDDCYGADRDIEHSLGGFVAVVENEADKELLKQYYLDVDNDIAEYEDTYDGFTERLYLLNDDFFVVVFEIACKK